MPQKKDPYARAVHWELSLAGGTRLSELDGGWRELAVPRLAEARLLELVAGNGSRWGVDLLLGRFMIGGMAVEPCKEVDARTFSFSGMPDAGYNLGASQYKLSREVVVSRMELEDNPGGIVKLTPFDPPVSHSIGFKVPVPPWACRYERRGFPARVSKCHAMLTVMAADLSCRLSVSLVEETTMPDGSVRSNRL
jgi:hypothetical protein